jgi:hypothetical protein
MENVVQFPTKAVRDWASLERTLKDLLGQAGVSQACKDRITERMKAFWEQLDPKMDLAFDVRATPPVDAAQLHAILWGVSDTIGEKCGTQLQAFTNSLFIERFYREVEACTEVGIL